jgi:hypothetical protein
VVEEQVGLGLTHELGEVVGQWGVGDGEAGDIVGCLCDHRDSPSRLAGSTGATPEDGRLRQHPGHDDSARLPAQGRAEVRDPPSRRRQAGRIRYSPVIAGCERRADGWQPFDLFSAGRGRTRSSWLRQVMSIELHELLP